MDDQSVNGREGNGSQLQDNIARRNLDRKCQGTKKNEGHEYADIQH